MNTLIFILDNTTLYLSHHTVLSYVVLFWGSFFETIIGPGFFIYGELFFIPGGILAGTGALSLTLVALSAISGGVLGDYFSYEIGRRKGASFFKEGNRFFSLTNYEKGSGYFKKYGAKVIFMARLLGPLSWVTPFLAGVYKIPRKTYFFYNVTGVAVGVGQFLLAGYIFGANYKQGLIFIQEKLFTILGILAILFILYVIMKRNFPDFIPSLKRKLLHS